jgi:hypothetical protein
MRMFDKQQHQQQNNIKFYICERAGLCLVSLYWFHICQQNKKKTFSIRVKFEYELYRKSEEMWKF